MSTNGQLVFTDVDKITFKGVGNTSNAVVDTVTGKIGVGIDNPEANLHVLGNSYVSTNLELGGTLIMGTVNVEAYHSLEAVTATGNTTPLTVEFSNATTGLVSTGNVEVGKELTVTGNTTVSSNLIVSGDVTVDTDTLHVDATNNRVGIGTTSPGEKLQIVGDSIAMSSGPTSDNYGQLSLTSVSNYTGGSKPTQLKFGIDHTVGSFGRGFIQGIVDSVHAGIDLCLCPKGGNVGVGTTTPGQKLSIYTGSTSTAALSFDRYPTDNYRTDIYQNSYGPDFRVGYGSHAPATVFTLERFSDGSKLACVGDAINPILRLRTTKSGDAWGTASSDQYGKLQWWGNDYEMNQGQGAEMASITVGTTSQYPGAMQMRFFVGSPTFSGGNWNLTYVGYLGTSPVSDIDFTGQHRNFIDGIPATEYTDYEGLIVSANKNKYYDVDKNVTTGVNAIQISQSLPLVSLSTKEKDKACFGVISGSEDPDTREYSQGSYVSVCEKQNGDRRAFINSVGEGAIWVTNINGPLESGDYITTSNVAGYGQKQDSESLKNYTVAKITMDCDFEPMTQPVQIIKKEMGDVNYWVKTTYEKISEEEYSNLTDEKRRIVEGDYQKITIEESETEQDGYELQVRQELVNILDEHGQIQWEDHPTETEKAYKIRYLDADGNIADEANAVHKAAFVGCTYHCG